MKTFEELGLGQAFLENLKAEGLEIPSEIQEKTIPLALAGRDVIGGAATGSGKTLAFSSAIIEHLVPNGKVQALILTPTRELADQVCDAVEQFSKHKDLRTVAVYGGVDINRQIRQLSHTDIVVGTPGRILDHLNRRTIRLNFVKFLVLDEVDRMLDMGFLRDVEKILAQCATDRQTMLFSATISPSMIHLAKKHTKNAEEIAVQSYVDHSKLKQVYYDLENDEKMSLLIHLLEKGEDGELVMIFCNTRHRVDFVAHNLAKHGINAKAIHGGLTQNKRTSNLEEFHGKGVSVLVCTDVAARGLDIKGVSHVYNYEIPPTSTDYIHRIGRTARAGSEGKVINFVCNRDYENFNNVLMDKNIFISSEQVPEFKKIYVETNQRREGFGRGNFGSGRGGGRSFGGNRGRSSGGGSRGRSYGGGQRSFGGGQRRESSDGERSRDQRSFGGRSSSSDSRNRHDHGPRSGPRKGRTNRFGGGRGRRF